MREEWQEIDSENEDSYFEHKKIPVDPAQSPLRLDKFLLLRLPATSRNRIQNLIINEFVLVNGKNQKSNYKVRPGDEIVIAMPEPPRSGEILAEKMDLNIVFEDDDLMIINKPAGMVVHPATDNWTGTLENGLRYYLAQQGLDYQGLVHRIDKDTTGLLVVPKNEEAKFFLAKQFFDHSIERTYYAIVWGEPAQESGTIVGNIGRSQHDRRLFVVYPDSERGKHAVTHYKVLARHRYISLVKCNLETGRTHQIRVHLKHIGHPLFSDSFYGGDKILKGTIFSKYRSFVENCFEILPRQGLHAKTLGFIHPRSQKFIEFDSELPSDFATVLQRWSDYVKNH
jgi:23S rRNA pseudouridine1911/1915/1917 synthase